MCGIVGYIGKKIASPILIEGLKRLEYRGYDSAGVALINGTDLVVRRAAGRISALEERLDEATEHGVVGIAHTRWATHGVPNEANAHPHVDQKHTIAMAHNGIIENYSSLRRYLEGKGVEFTSETDTEVLAQLIGYIYNEDGLSLEEAIQTALREVRGTYGLAVVSPREPGKLVAARKGSPLIIGVGDSEYVVASDAAAIVEHTNQVVYLADNEMAVLTDDSFRTTTIDNIPVTKDVHQIEMTLDQIELAGFEHFMLKEIFEQPESLRNAMRGRIDTREGRVHLGGLTQLARELVRAHRIIFTACGTAWHAGLIGEFLFEDLARIPAETEYASEFRYRNPIIEDNTVVCAISQSGETADTLAALHEAKDKGALALGIVNTVGSTIARDTDAGVYLHAGPEIGVASTKAFTCQITVLAMMAAFVGRRKHMSQQALQEFLEALLRIPDQIEKVCGQSDTIAQIAADYTDAPHWLYLGRGYQYPIALEGALKLKEISYLHAEGMPAAEMKHGPIALINDGMPAVFIAPRCANYEKIIGNIEEVKSRGGRILAVANEGDTQIAKLADHVFEVPSTLESLQPLLTVVPLQLLAYHVAVLRGCNVDKPRNLAKSVTVE